MHPLQTRIPLLAILAALLAFTAGCDSNEAPSRRELLTAHARIFQNLEVTTDREDVEASWSDRTEFLADGTLIMSDSLGSDTGTWRFDAAESEIILSGEGQTIVLDLLELTEAVLRVRWDIAVLNTSVEVTMVPE